MKLLIQRVKEASVLVEGKIAGEIGPGLLIFVGITHSDTIPESAKDFEFGHKRDEAKSKRSAPNDEASPRWAG